MALADRRYTSVILLDVYSLSAVLYILALILRAYIFLLSMWGWCSENPHPIAHLLITSQSSLLTKTYNSNQILVPCTYPLYNTPLECYSVPFSFLFWRLVSFILVLSKKLLVPYYQCLLISKQCSDGFHWNIRKSVYLMDYGFARD